MKGPTKTISQNQFKPKSKEQGFTLIELLVVIAIIALLASIIIVSLQDARDRAKNSKKNQMVVQYINALELYRSEHPEKGYPDYGAANNTIDTHEYFCLGVPDGQTCYGNLSDGNSNLISELEKYIPGVPADDVSVMVSSSRGDFDYKGFTYACGDKDNDPDDEICNSFVIDWYLIGKSKSCGRGFVYNDKTINTMCRYKSTYKK